MTLFRPNLLLLLSSRYRHRQQWTLAVDLDLINSAVRSSIHQGVARLMGRMLTTAGTLYSLSQWVCNIDSTWLRLLTASFGCRGTADRLDLNPVQT